jgi:pimeloyl-ACP methyl ester carboxylesterase
MDFISIFKNPECEASYIAAYDAVLAHWPVPYETINIPTRFGETHIIASGPKDGSPLLLLPGNFDCSLSWFHSVAALSITHRVYALDTIGDVGKSKACQLPKDREDYANWLADVFDGLHIISADLIGISYGGFLAANFALKYKERATRLVLLCPGLPLAPFTLQWIIRGMPMILHPSNSTARWFIQGASTSRKQDELMPVFILGITAARSMSVIRPTFQEDEWQKLKMPILLLVGDHEIMYEPTKAIEQAKKLFPDLHPEIIRDAGHFLLADQVQQVNRHILTFLDSVPVKDGEKLST